MWKATASLFTIHDSRFKVMFSHVNLIEPGSPGVLSLKLFARGTSWWLEGYPLLS